jgi:hypothetical protein
MSAAVMTAYRQSVRRRVARKVHSCQWGNCPDSRSIHPGDVYLEATEFPGGESGYATHAGQPIRMAVCARCACGFGHDHLLEPVPVEQVYRDGLA